MMPVGPSLCPDSDVTGLPWGSSNNSSVNQAGEVLRLVILKSVVSNNRINFVSFR